MFCLCISQVAALEAKATALKRELVDHVEVARSHTEKFVESLSMEELENTSRWCTKLISEPDGVIVYNEQATAIETADSMVSRQNASLTLEKMTAPGKSDHRTVFIS